MKYIVRIIGWVLWKFGYLEKKCEHKRFTRKQWFDSDGTPMVYFNCWDCGYNDRGHVHGDPEQMRKDGWEKEEYAS